METGTLDTNDIIAGDFPLKHKKVTLLSGAGALIRGTVLGLITVAGATSAAKSGGNTGGGTLTLDVTTPVLAGAKPGIYQVRIVGLTANAGLAVVTDPKGRQIGNYQVGAAAFADQIKFAMADVGTDFAVGDGFDITVAAGSGKAVKSATAATDGSQDPYGILAVDADATSADVDAPAYITGDFSQEKLTYGTGHSAATVEAAFRAAQQDIFLHSIGAVA